MNDSLEWNIKLCSRLGQHICTFCELRSSLKSPKLKIDPFWLFYERLGRGLQRRRHWQKQLAVDKQQQASLNFKPQQQPAYSVESARS
ncbi:hypothetical protein T4E_881 [Trichinella pseudospiralis]|uniref:Uncharacterized protein n=1 Tax=Trichinella pseudospiralis TaxID=6337 RepID=A0A0V0XYM6_TRIPS|nr:hypothetical protein T4E_881 [Trichinella pseudospiralis]